ncbi:LysR family transcriptional regulator [Paraburkholderia caffeinilytica]|jgi:DNA-binding transcriptional LysR family regulator|uniref:Transcriptional regulator n=1 Tax=Paraburkholderia caffeinilytica TaxID=1761016 RepID=A0ABQ1N9X8_9BURK|nr:LysR family transcriptional regulator [Paraburkholderia caffeinilytica]AXL48695.1 LysR family transcriptional regulator [Paraburkholderia caffeinilytica]GGC62218.1 transcriptional regulator [Paraburkholderia caffeinilytica]CAB3798485.1 HTH-type transcriptional regulator PgrR [Paraburkholderia caffeinilytica]
MNEVRAITIFVRAAALGSLRKAAVDQGISPQAASHAVMQLERELGVRLFHRTTRKLSLTEEGQGLLDSVRPALAILSSALDDARRSKDAIAGPLRVSAPSAFWCTVLWPYFLEFAELHPNVQLDVQFDDHFTDLVSDRADVGFRGGSPPSGGTIARRLLPIQLIVCASPAYIERHGAPRTIDELDEHRCTGYRRANTGKQAPWEFLIGDEIVYRDVATTLCVNNTDAETQAVLAGLAIGQLGSFSAVLPIRRGELVPLLVRHVTQREAIYIYYRHRTEQPLRVRTFIDFMVERLAGNRDFYLEPSELRAAR